MRNPEAERRDLSYLLGASCAIELGTKVIPVPPPAPGHIALWYLADSPLLLRSRQWTDRDGLEALYILLKGNLAPVATSRPVAGERRPRDNNGDVLADAVDAFFVDAGPVDHAALRRDLEQMLRDAWHPYALMPHPEDAAEEGDRPDPDFGAEWLSALVTRVGAVTRYTPAHIIWDMPMAAAASYDVQYCRYVLKTRNIARRPENVAAMAAYWNRVYELASKHTKE